MMVRGDIWLPENRNRARPSPKPASPRRHTGVGSTVLRATVVVLLLNFDQFPRTVGRTFLLTAVALAVPLVLYEVFRPTSRARVVVFWVLLTFGILALPGILRTPESEYGQQKFFLLVTLTLLATLAVAVIRGRRDVEMFATVFVVCGVVLALAALAGDSQDGRSGGFGSNPIWLARAIGAAVVAVVWLYMRARLSAWSAAALAVLLALGLFATGSRGPLVATVVALLVLVLAGLRRRVGRGRREWTMVGLMAGLAATVIALPSLLPPRMYALLVDPSDELFGTARAEMRERTLSVIAEHPAGVGYGNWNNFAWMPEHNYPHNLWLELTAEAGWLVGAAFILAVAAVAVGLWHAARTDTVAGFVLALVAFNAVAVATSGDINASRALFCSLALGVLVLIGATSDDGGRSRSREVATGNRHGTAGGAHVARRRRGAGTLPANGYRAGVPPYARPESGRHGTGRGFVGEYARR